MMYFPCSVLGNDNIFGGNIWINGTDLWHTESTTHKNYMNQRDYLSDFISQMQMLLFHSAFTAEVTFRQKCITCQMAILVFQMAKQLREFLSNSSSKKKSTGRTIPSLRPHSDQIRHCCNEHRIVWQSGKTQLGAHHCLVCELCLYCTLFPVLGLGVTTEGGFLLLNQKTNNENWQLRAKVLTSSLGWPSRTKTSII